MTSGSLNERITRALAFMLRHQPEDFDLELDRFGWGELEDVLYALQERIGSQIEEEDVREAISAGDRKRYEIEDDRIRALYGHSFQIDPGEPSEPPDELFIGVGSRDASRAEEYGLRSGRRAFLHLARTEEEAREAGRRAARDYAVITVFAGEAFDEGIDFFDRGALFLADEVPVEFIEVGDVQHDGIERDRRSRGRRTADGPRGSRGSHRRHRGKDHDRDEDDRRPDREERPRPDRARGSRPDREPAAGREERRPPVERDERDEADALPPKRSQREQAPAKLERKPERRPEPKPELEPEPKPERKPERKSEPRAKPSKPSGFGAGIE